MTGMLSRWMEREMTSTEYGLWVSLLGGVLVVVTSIWSLVS